MPTRPSYETHVRPNLKLIEGWCRQGATDKDIAKRLKVGLSTFYDYKRRHSELSDALKNNKDIADTEIENALFKRAKGYAYIETETITDKEGNTVRTKTITKIVAPDPTACIFWLKNRKPAEWRDKQELNISNPDGTLKPSEPVADLSKLSISALKELRDAVPHPDGDK